MRIAAIPSSAVLHSAALVFVSLVVSTITQSQAIATFQHIVIIVQENRTPDNLFGNTPSMSVCNSEDPFEPGVDIKNCGYDFNGNAIYLTSRHLQDGLNPGHGHSNWNDQCDFNSTTGVCTMDGTCKHPPTGYTTDQCFAYVPKSDVQPYFDIATSYGFANYFFQTNQGPSLPAHQFLLSGTSAPVPYLTTHYDWFDAENTQDTVSGHGIADQHTGCTATYQTEYTKLVDPSGSEGAACSPSNPYCQFPCYDHPTLVDLLDGATSKISWKYYAPTAGGLWNAPTAVKKICVPSLSYNGVCTGNDWKNYVKPFLETKQNPVPIYADINNCQLPAVSWVIPDKKWSDHANEDDGSGPDYVANIVNGIGWSTCTDTVNGKQVPYWQDTAILITWDDWGGWFDHVSPFKLGGQSNGWGAKYTYGFRVPLLVVSAYTPAGYVSGALPSPGMDANHIHDFGSILAFVEHNFLGGNGIGKIGPTQYPFADAFAPELAAGFVPLADFFPIPSTMPRLFQGIPVDPLHGQSYFQNYFTVTDPSDTPDGPDADND
jgi:phospholipase C